MIGFHPLLRRLRHGGAAILWSRTAPHPSQRGPRGAHAHTYPTKEQLDRVGISEDTSKIYPPCLGTYQKRGIKTWVAPPLPSRPDIRLILSLNYINKRSNTVANNGDASDLQKLWNITAGRVSQLASEGVLVRSKPRGHYQLVQSLRSNKRKYTRANGRNST